MPFKICLEKRKRIYLEYVVSTNYNPSTEVFSMCNSYMKTFGDLF